MKIGFQIHHFDPAFGGTSAYVDRLGRRLAEAGHEVHVFSEVFRAEPPHICRHVVTPYRPGPVDAATAAAGLDIVVGLGRMSRGMDIFRPSGGTVLGTRRQKLARFRLSLMRPLWRLWTWLHLRHRAAAANEKRLYSQTDPPLHFIAQSRLVRDDMRRYYDVPDERIHIIANGVDAAKFSPEQCRPLRQAARREWNVADDEVCFVFVGHAFLRKGIRELMDAARILKRQGRRFRVLFVGRPQRNLALPRYLLARLHGCRDKVVFTGEVRPVLRAYAAADVFVLPTWYDPCANVVFEAAGCGLPVITTRFNGAAEPITEGVEGFVLDTPADTAALADRMARLFDADLRARMGTAARAMAERFTVEDNLRRMTELFELVVRRKMKAAGRTT